VRLQGHIRFTNKIFRAKQTPRNPGLHSVVQILIFHSVLTFGTNLNWSIIHKSFHPRLRAFSPGGLLFLVRPVNFSANNYLKLDYRFFPTKHTLIFFSAEFTASRPILRFRRATRKCQTSIVVNTGRGREINSTVSENFWISTWRWWVVHVDCKSSAHLYDFLVLQSRCRPLTASLSPRLQLAQETLLGGLGRTIPARCCPLPPRPASPLILHYAVPHTPRHRRRRPRRAAGAAA
jgi:hypothetical protein